MFKIVNTRPSKISKDIFRERMNLDKTRWMHLFSTNCYAYVLGLDIPERKIMPNAFVPGTISHGKQNLDRAFTMEELLLNLFDDFNFLGIDFTKCNPHDEIEENEWKIALFTSYYADIMEYYFLEEYYQDFHFMRERKDGTWYHKKGFNYRPKNIDSNKQIITDPRICHLKDYNYRLTYKLKLK